MRWALLAALLVVGACRDDAVVEGHDLSSPTLYCPTAPPASGAYACDPTAIPFCTFPAEQVTCFCRADAMGQYALDCSVDMGATD